MLFQRLADIALLTHVGFVVFVVEGGHCREPSDQMRVRAAPGSRYHSRENPRLNERWLKSVTGGEPITCRGLYRDPFTYHPQFKLWLSASASG